MAERFGIYKCNLCGNIVEVLTAGGGGLVCCGKPAVRLVPKTEDAGREKHVPVVEKVAGGIKVKLGEVPHPMEEKHYIEWIAVLVDGGIMRTYLNPGDVPEHVFPIEDPDVKAMAYCNIHGLWQN